MSGDVRFRPTTVQLEILRLLERGATDRVIAHRLNIGERTVRVEISKVAAVTGANGRFALGAVCARLGWLESDDLRMV